LLSRSILGRWRLAFAEQHDDASPRLVRAVKGVVFKKVFTLFQGVRRLLFRRDGLPFCVSHHLERADQARLRTHWSEPEDDGCGDADGGHEGVCATVV